MRTPTWCRRQAADIGPACVVVIDELLADNALFRLRAAQGVLGLADKHDPARLEAACAKATAAGDPSYRTIKGILAAGTETAPAPGRAVTAARRRTCTDPRSCSPTPTLIPHLAVGATVIPLPTVAGPAVADMATATSTPQHDRRHRHGADLQPGRIMSVDPTAPTPTDQATSDPALLVPTHPRHRRARHRRGDRRVPPPPHRPAYQRAQRRPGRAGRVPAPQGRAVHPARRRPGPVRRAAGTRTAHPMSSPTTPSSSTPIIDNNALTASLRALKLGGMLQTLDARLAQARAGELGHLEFLQVLCHDEISRRETTSIARRTRRARFEETLTLEGFDFTAAPKLPAAQIRDLAALRWLQAGESVILYGPVGVGKTHIAQALAHLAIRAGAEARFIKTSRALAELAGGHADGTWTRRLRELARPAVLVLDDFAMRELTPAQADDLYELINERSRPLADPDLEPLPGRLVSAVPQPRRRRVPARPADQQQPPTPHERSQLPTPQTTRARRPHGHHDHQLDCPQRTRPGELPDRSPWGIT